MREPPPTVEDKRPPPKGPGERAIVFGAFFNLMSYLLTRGVNLLVTVALARELAPEGMGVIAAALLAVEMIDIVHGFGLRESLIYDRDVDRRRQSTAFVIIAVTAVLQMGAMLAIAPVSANFVDDPLIVPIMMWLSLLFPITSLGTVHEAVLFKNFEFRKMAGVEVVSVVAKGVVSLGLLYLGYGVWSFVIGIFAAQISKTAVLWMICDWRPSSPDLRGATILGMLRYGVQIVLVGSVHMLKSRSDQLSIVTAVGDTSLGIYFIATRIPDIVISGVSITLSKIVFPVFANANDDRERLSDMYLMTIYGCMLMLAPVSVGLMSIAPTVIPLIFGEGWSGAVPVLMVLALLGIPQTLGWTAGDVFKATGRPQLLTLLTVIQTAFTAPLVFFLAVTTKDLVVIALGMLVGETFGAALRLWVMQRYEGVGVLPTLGAAFKPVFSAGVMGGVIYLCRSWTASLPGVVELGAIILLGAVVYVATLLLIDRKSFLFWLRTLNPLTSRKKLTPSD